jgi:hypothetical protein
MNVPHFLRIERDGRGRTRHFVVHTVDPKFSIKLAPDSAAPDNVGREVIKRVRMPNSWARDCAQSAKLMGAAQEIFAQSFAAPAAKTESRRFSR